METGHSLYKHTDYRVFLQSYAQKMTQKRPGWSYSVWARQLKLKDPSSLNKILQGRRHPGTSIVNQMIRYFKFTEKQALYFRDLVSLHKVKDDPRLSVLILEKMGKTFPNGAFRQLTDREFVLISNWMAMPIRELIRSPYTVKKDAHDLSTLCLFKITAREIQKLIQIMIDLELIRRDEKGTLVVAEGRVDTTSDLSSEALRRAHHQVLLHTIEALESIPVNQREFTTRTFLMRQENLSRAKELIRQFKIEFEKLLEEESGDRVVQLQIQFYPLTEKLKEN